MRMYSVMLQVSTQNSDAYNQLDEKLNFRSSQSGKT